MSTAVLSVMKTKIPNNKDHIEIRISRTCITITVTATYTETLVVIGLDRVGFFNFFPTFKRLSRRK